MTRIFISHSHSDWQIAERLVDFLYAAALTLRPEDIRCTSVPGHQLPFGTSIGEQLKGDLNKTTGLIALITKDSLRSTWVLFELGSGWATEKLVVPILGPGLNYQDLPGPLANYPGVRIDEENPNYRMIDVINQLVSALDIQVETNARREAKLDSFIKEFRAWKSQLPEPNLSLQKQVESLKAQLQELEQTHTEQLQSSAKATVTEGIELKSEKGVDYTKLRDLLAAGKWKEADQETAKVILQAVVRESEGWLRTEDIDNFPCKHLRTINQLWLHYSKGNFGFSVQKEIYESLGGTREYNEEVWKQFGDRVGWRKGGNWLRDYSDLTFNINAPQAHLPTICVVAELWGFGCGNIFSRAKTCNL